MKRILIAEDDRTSRLMLSEALHSFGYEVVEAVDGEEAVQKAMAGAPDALLLDVQMPRLDGFSVLRRIRSLPETAQLPVLALTAFAMSGDEQKCRAAGFDDYISKPINLARLRHKLESLFGGGEENA